jgi:hypothetical protein
MESSSYLIGVTLVNPQSNLQSDHPEEHRQETRGLSDTDDAGDDHIIVREELHSTIIPSNTFDGSECLRSRNNSDHKIASIINDIRKLEASFRARDIKLADNSVKLADIEVKIAEIGVEIEALSREMKSLNELLSNCLQVARQIQESNAVFAKCHYDLVMENTDALSDDPSRKKQRLV